jgi:hypothetical protein
MFYEDVFRVLNRNKVKYVVFGGVAVALHGVMRFTVDLDLVVKMVKDNLNVFFDAMAEIGYVPKVPVSKSEFINIKNYEKWKREKGMKVFSFINLNEPIKVVDMLIMNYIKYDLLDSKKEIKLARGLEIPVVSIEHLRKFKKIAGRPQDLVDIRDLKRVENLNNEKK